MRPPRSSVKFENRQLSFRDMDRTANQMAGWLSKQGYKKGQAIALVTTPRGTPRRHRAATMQPPNIPMPL